MVAAIAFLASLMSFFEIFKAFKISDADAGFAKCFFISPPSFRGAVVSFLDSNHYYRDSPYC